MLHPRFKRVAERHAEIKMTLTVLTVEAKAANTLGFSNNAPLLLLS